MEKILITGANGYIGNCLFHFLKGKFNVIGIDKEKTFNNKIYKCDLLNTKKLDLILKKEKPDTVIHLAAQSLVDQTINKRKYLRNNVIATNRLMKLMKENKIKRLVFSSTAAIYKDSNSPLKENSKIKPLSNYAKSKLVCEKNIIKNKNINSVILRFFNVCGSLNKPRIGLFKSQVTHLIPTVVYKTLFNKTIHIYGNDYDTPDGTCIRDYIHIKDICSAIKKSIFFLKKKNNSEIFNVGNRIGISNSSVVCGCRPIRRYGNVISSFKLYNLAWFDSKEVLPNISITTGSCRSWFEICKCWFIQRGSSTRVIWISSILQTNVDLVVFIHYKV